MFNKMINKELFFSIVEYYGAEYSDKSCFGSEAVQELLNTHIKNKEHIFKLFGNKLRIERDIETTVTNIEATGIRQSLLKTLSTNKKLFFVCSLIRSISIDEFIANTIEGDRTIFGISIPKGMKVSKALSRLCLKEDMETVTIAHSMAIQQLKAKGKIVISIDPCDYVTMSSNNSDWRSCHRLDGGEYRTGPLAYLRDPSSVICYVESSNPCTFKLNGNKYEHTNKSWRQIALVSPNLEYALQERQYPNTNTINEGEVSKLFKELFEELNKEEYTVNSMSSSEINDLHIDSVEERGTNYVYYNDISHEMFDNANVVAPVGFNFGAVKDNQKPLKGADVYCIECGRKLSDSESLFCYNCYNEDDEY